MRNYQVALLGGHSSDEAAAFERNLRDRFAELHIDPGLLSLLNPNSLSQLDPKSPAVGVYFALQRNPTSDPTAEERFLANGYVVVPVVRNLSEYAAHTPSCLHPINGYELRPADSSYSELCGLVLENLSLLRKSRRVFISYRHAESRGVAIQLYEELDRRTFDVFLDTIAIRPGEPFQEVLWHRLADTDVMVLLDSPGFLDSRWTEEELARANSTSLQILQIVWPGHTQAARAAFSFSHELQSSDFVDPAVTLGVAAHLSPSVAAQIALETESLRARALAARHAYLVQEMFREAAAVGAAITAQPNRSLQVTRADGKRAVVMPTVGVPDAIRYQEIEESLDDSDNAELVLVYDDRGVRDRWLQHLSWLDPRMRVRSLKIRDASRWIAGTAIS